MDFYKSALFQIQFENTNYLGIFTYNFFVYSYFEYMNKEDKKENNNITKYISFFMNSFLENKSYTIYFITELNENKSNIVMDKNIVIDCILDEKNKRFSFLKTNISQNDFINIQKNMYSNYDISDYSELEKPFLDVVERKPEVKKNSRYHRKTVKRCYDSESDQSEYEYDTEDEEKFKTQYKKYEEEESFSIESRKNHYENAQNKYNFWNNMKSKLRENKELYHYCRLREATQYYRKFLYKDDNIFRIRYLFEIKYLDIENENNLNSDFENNDDLEVVINIEMVSKCGKYKSDATISKSGCYDNGGFSIYSDIDYVENVEKRTFKEFYMNLFERYNPLDI